MTRTLHACLGWRNVSARHRDALAAERKERARIRGEKAFAGDTDPLAA
ncbi:integrase [Streptomyces sp. NBC_01571]|nr:integrase [Streptomyces sp. NBC_01571]MCX4572811.1 integrase [Streptomyces sp. NBC_01571]